MSRAREAAPLLAGLALLLVSWLLFTHVGFWSAGSSVDTELYRSYGVGILQGKVPYRDFAVDYPPGSLPVFVLPAIGEPATEAAFRPVFEWVMFGCGALLLLAVEATLRRLGATPPQRLVLLAAAGIAPLVLGSTSARRYDLWPALLTAAALALHLRRRPRLGGAVLGLAVAAKVYPVVLAPVLLADVWRREGRRAAAESAAGLAGVFAACVVPFAALAPHGTVHSFTAQLSRPLQLESLGAALLVAAHQVAGLSVGVEPSYGSDNLGGGRASTVAALTTAVEVAFLLWIWWSCARRRLRPAEVATAAAASVAALVAFGKVFSPQYLLWLLPLVPVVDRRLRRPGVLLLLVALGLTQGWFPRRYGQLERLDALESWLLLARDLVVVALAVLLARAVSARDPSERAVQLGGAVSHPAD